MIDCLILGDSIAVGTGLQRPECRLIAKSGINSWQWVNSNVDKSPYVANTVIISLGSNDYKGINTEEELRTIRKLTKGTVYWILPANKKDIRDIVFKIANEYHDHVVKIADVSADGVHPTARGYKMISEQTK